MKTASTCLSFTHQVPLTCGCSGPELRSVAIATSSVFARLTLTAPLTIGIDEASAPLSIFFSSLTSSRSPMSSGRTADAHKAGVLQEEDDSLAAVTLSRRCCEACCDANGIVLCVSSLDGGRTFPSLLVVNLAIEECSGRCQLGSVRVGSVWNIWMLWRLEQRHG